MTIDDMPWNHQLVYGVSVGRVTVLVLWFIAGRSYREDVVLTSRIPQDVISEPYGRPYLIWQDIEDLELATRFAKEWLEQCEKDKGMFLPSP